MHEMGTVMTDNLQIKRVSPVHIRLVLKSKPGDKIKWQQDLRRKYLFLHRRHIKDLAKKHALDGKTLLYKIKFSKTIQPKNASGKNLLKSSTKFDNVR